MKKTDNKSVRKRILIAVACVAAVAVVVITVLYVNGNLSFRKADESSVQPVRVACVGDSITYGLCLGHAQTESYPAVLGALLGDGFTVKNYGVSGATAMYEGDSPYVSTAQYTRSLEFQPDVVILMFGTNDAKDINWQGSEAFIADYEKLVKGYLELESQPEVYLMAPPPLFTGEGSGEASAAEIVNGSVCPAVQHVSADMGLGFVDINSALTDRADMFSDGIHPNADGAAFVARLAYKEITSR